MTPNKIPNHGILLFYDTRKNNLFIEISKKIET